MKEFRDFADIFLKKNSLCGFKINHNKKSHDYSFPPSNDFHKIPEAYFVVPKMRTLGMGYKTVCGERICLLKLLLACNRKFFISVNGQYFLV